MTDAETPDLAPRGADLPDAAADPPLPETAAPDAALPAGRRPAPSAQAASRARRIGGRPVPGPRAEPGGQAPRSEDLAAPRTARRSALAVPTRAGALPEAPEPRTEAELRYLNRLRWIPAGVAGVAAVVLAATVVWLSHGVWWAKPSPPDLRGEVLAAAKTCMPKVGSYDYRSLDASLAQGLACSTGTFRANYERAMKTVVASLAPQTKTIQTVSVTRAGIVSVSPDARQWVVLIYGQQKIQNNTTAKTQPRYDLLSVTVTMNRVGNSWLISQESLAN